MDVYENLNVYNEIEIRKNELYPGGYMKKHLTFVFIPTLILIILLTLVSCPSPDDGTGPGSSIEFVGTWKRTPDPLTPSIYESFTYTETECVYTSTLPGFVGSFTDQILSYDQTANHIEEQCTAVSGIYPPSKIGETYLITYKITGNTIQFSSAFPPTYPPDATGDYYTKQ